MNDLELKMFNVKGLQEAIIIVSKLIECHNFLAQYILNVEIINNIENMTLGRMIEFLLENGFRYSDSAKSWIKK